MNLRKLLFLGLIGFYSCMPIQARYSSGQYAYSHPKFDSEYKNDSFLQKYDKEIVIGYVVVMVCLYASIIYMVVNQNTGSSIVLTPKQLERVAYHEIGHTLVALHNEAFLGNPFDKVTIISGAGALGLTTLLPSAENMNLLTKDQYLANIRFLLGGYVAEELMCGQTSTTVSNDLQVASSLARSMVTLYGMHENTGKVVYAGYGYSEGTLQKIDDAVQQIVEEQYEWVKAFLGEKKESLQLLGDALLKEKTLTAAQVKELLAVDSASTEISVA